MKTIFLILIILTTGLLLIQCDSSTDAENDSNPTEGKITVSGDYQTSFKYVMGLSSGNGAEYTGVIATQSLDILADEFGFGLYADGHAVFTKSLGNLQWLGYTATNLDAAYDVSDTCKPCLMVNHIVLYYDSSYISFQSWEFNPANLDSSKSVIIHGEMSTDYRKLGLCGN
jgi:hypothetical protein